jgi:hypothetical protein
LACGMEYPRASLYLPPPPPPPCCSPGGEPLKG